MIGLIIVTHETVGEAYRKLANHFFSGMGMAKTALLGISPDEDHDDVIGRIQESIRELDCPDGVLVLADIFGATPCNAARKLVVPGKVAMLTGLNAPMMVKAVQYHTQTDDLLLFAAQVKQAAIDGILEITHPPE
ncbi:PTS sugar transporter subunit IIA [Neisseria leonii]|uniref:PTS sugar transporter subunit IIA n=1 Tax=Neisseria leonii TaxID=2995413 RepID=UPI00237BFC51|nr:PTS mannose transporter subunit IIA [Neisseria sp. 3986]MDD9326676.1 PTS mannose transporter subunit IIA [Neisseria sp. 3986]